MSGQKSPFGRRLEEKAEERADGRPRLLEDERQHRANVSAAHGINQHTNEVGTHKRDQEHYREYASRLKKAAIATAKQ